jgi:prophage regulatory protein
MQARQEPSPKLPTDLLHDRLINTSEAAAFAGFSESHWRALVRTGRAPQPIRLSTRKMGWKISALRAWIDQAATAA